MADDAGALLVRAGLITASALDAARARQAQDGGTVGEHLVVAGMVTDERLTEFYRTRLLVPQVHPNTLARLDPTVVGLLPADLAAELRAVPVAIDKDGNLVVAMSDPSDRHAVDEIGFFTGKFVVRAVATQMQVAWCLAQYYDCLTELGERLLQPVAAPSPAPAPAPAPAPVPATVAPLSPRAGDTGRIEASRHRVLAPVTTPPPVVRPSGATLDRADAPAPVVAPVSAPAPAPVSAPAPAPEAEAVLELDADEPPPPLPRGAFGGDTPQSPVRWPSPGEQTGFEGGPSIIVSAEATRPTRLRPAVPDPPELAARAGEVEVQVRSARSFDAPTVSIEINLGDDDDEAAAPTPAPVPAVVPAPTVEPTSATVEPAPTVEPARVAPAAPAAPLAPASPAETTQVAVAPVAKVPAAAPSPAPAAAPIAPASSKPTARFAVPPLPTIPMAPAAATEPATAPSRPTLQVPVVPPPVAEAAPARAAAEPAEVTAVPAASPDAATGRISDPALAIVTLAGPPEVPPSDAVPEPIGESTSGDQGAPAPAPALIVVDDERADDGDEDEGAVVADAAGTESEPILLTTPRRSAELAAVAPPPRAQAVVIETIDDSSGPVLLTERKARREQRRREKGTMIGIGSLGPIPRSGEPTPSPYAPPELDALALASGPSQVPEVLGPREPGAFSDDTQPTVRHKLKFEEHDALDDGWDAPGTTIPPGFLGATEPIDDGPSAPVVVPPEPARTRPAATLTPANRNRTVAGVPDPSHLAELLEEASQRLVELLSGFDQAGHRDHVVAMLVDYVAESHYRVAFLALRGDELVPFMQIPEPSGPPTHLDLRTAATFQDVIGTRLPYRGPISDPASRELVKALFGSATDEMLVVPVAVKDRVVGVIYADGRHRHSFDEHVTVAGRAAGLALQRILQVKKA